ncbi:hypothetical protein EC957_002004 [Mortierella hygrophila]|uniref:NACHT domain-containing protein n=1 Tax=Mortierella hygrophila TaxID=979708 RepID=A0A9P6K6Z5_9FUNG|nr:hypothetical protein EC957_002004 [Mortierella hygrophila]
MALNDTFKTRHVNTAINATGSMDSNTNSKRPLSSDIAPDGESVVVDFEAPAKKTCFAKDEPFDDESTTHEDVTTARLVQSNLISPSTTSALEYKIHRLITARLEGYTQPVYIPPQAKRNLGDIDKHAFPLMQNVKEFLESKQQVFLVMGDSGSGKSTFNRHLEQDLLKSYKLGDPIPLFINLPDIEKPQKELISEYLKTKNFSEDDIQYLKENRKVIIICDSYDESQLTINLHSTNSFNLPGQWDTKMVIGCRSTYLGQDYRERFQPQSRDRYQPATPHLFREAAIISFSHAQIEAYVEQFVQEPKVHELFDGQATWNAKEYMEKLKTIKDLMDLVKNPFMLSVALRALPAVVKGITDISKIKMTRLSLYQSFVGHWIHLGKLRLLSMKMDAGTMDVLEELLDDGFSNAVMDFLKDVAVAIFHEQDGDPIVQFTQRKDGATWKAKFFGPRSEFTLLRESSPLTRAGVQYQFIHASLLEYFFSCHIFDTAANVDFGDHPLTQMNLVRRPAVVLFLAEFAQANLDFKQHLLQFIEQSKEDEKASQAASNAITILIKAGVSFYWKDLRGIRIPGADLSRGEFDSAQLQGADLTGCNLSYTWLRHADLSGAHLAELCYSFFEDRSECPAFNHNEILGT